MKDENEGLIGVRRQIHKGKVRKMLLAGKSQASISRKLRISISTIRRLFTVEEMKEIKATKKTTQRKKRPLTTEILSLRGQRITVEHPYDPEEYTKHGFDLYEWSDSRRTMRKYVVKVIPDLGISRATANIPFREFNPPKRIHQAAKSMFNWYLARIGKTEKEWHAKRRYATLLEPETPKMKLPFHDLDTVNAKIGFANNKRDRKLTQADACIVSEAFTRRVIIEQSNIRGFTTLTRELHVGDTFNVGAIIDADIEDVAVRAGNTIKYDGTITEVLDKQTQTVGNIEYNLYGVRYEGSHRLTVGDKLRSLTGLKVVIGEVREDIEADIVIHPNQIKSKTGIKGAVLKELTETGYLMVGIRGDEIISKLENTAMSGSLSVGLYPVLKIFDEPLLNKIIRDNSKLNQYLESLHLALNKAGQVVITDKMDTSDTHYIKAAHYLWNPTLIYAEETVQRRVQEFGSRIGSGEMITMHKHIWESLFIPDFVTDKYVDTQTGKIKDLPLVSYKGKEWSERHTTDGHGKCPFLIQQAKTGTQYNKMLKNVLFPKINGKYLKAIPQTDLPIDVVVVGFNFPAKGTIWREPVIGKDSVYSVKIKYDASLNPFVIKISPELIKQANGDYDGDDWSLIPYYSPALIPDMEIIKPIEADMGTIDIDVEAKNLEPQPSSTTKAVDYMREQISRNKDIGDVGGVIKWVSLETDDIETHKKLLDFARMKEVVLKPELHTDYLTYRRKIKETIGNVKGLITRWTHDYKPQGSYKLLLTLYGKKQNLDIQAILGFDITVHPFWVNLWQTCKKEDVGMEITKDYPTTEKVSMSKVGFRKYKRPLIEEEIEKT